MLEAMACCAVFVCFLAMLVGCLLTLLQRRGMLVTGQARQSCASLLVGCAYEIEAVPDLGIPTMSMMLGLPCLPSSNLHETCSAIGRLIQEPRFSNRSGGVGD